MEKVNGIGGLFFRSRIFQGYRGKIEYYLHKTAPTREERRKVVSSGLALSLNMRKD